jgi:iron(III) transport system substrate-binding protein
MIAKIKVWVALFLVFPVMTVIAAEEPANLADAKKEGKVVLYVSAQLPLAQAISRAFEKKYPFLKVEITRTSGENLLNRIKTEKLAGKVAFDVVYGATVPLMPTLGVVKPYLSPEAKAYPMKFREPKDFWAGVSANYYVIGYNSKLVTKNEAPREWKDLLHPRWKGQFAMDPEEFSWFGAMEAYLGEEESKKLMTGLARQDIQWRKNHTTLAQFLAAGE